MTGLHKPFNYMNRNMPRHLLTIQIGVDKITFSLTTYYWDTWEYHGKNLICKPGLCAVDFLLFMY